MSEVHKIARNTVFLMMTQVSYVLFTFIFIVYLARILGPPQFGRFFFALTLSSVLSLVLTFRIEGLLVRELSRESKRIESYLSNAILLHVTLGILALLVLNCSFFVIGRVLEVSSFPILMTNILMTHFILTNISQDCESVFRSLERMEFLPLAMLLERGVILVSGLILLSMNPTPINGSLPFVIGSVLRLGYNSFILSTLSRIPSLTLRGKVLEVLLKRGYIFAFGTFLSFFLADSLTLVLSVLGSNESVGLYGVCITISAAIGILGRSFANGLYPRMARTAADSTKELRILSAKAVMLSMIGGSIFTVALFFSAEDLIILLYGRSYQSAIPYLKIVALAMPLLFVLPVLGNHLVSEMKEKDSLIVSCIAGLSGTIAAIPMVYSWGVYGAVYGYLFSLLANLILQSLISGKIIRSIVLKASFFVSLILICIWLVLLSFEMVVSLNWISSIAISWLIIFGASLGTSKDIRLLVITLIRGEKDHD